MKTVNYSVVIPVFNEEENIKLLYPRLKSVLGKVGKSYEIIFIDDGSHDNSFNILKELYKKNKNIKIIKFSRNFGQQRAYTAGIAYATGKALILMDADLQHPPELIPDMIKLWEEGNKVVYTIKTSRKEGFIMRFFFNSFYKILRFTSGRTLPFGSGIFSLIDKEVADILRSMPEKNKYLSGLRAYVGFKQVGIKFESGKRHIGGSRQTLAKHFRLAFDAVFSFSYLPLRLAMLGGVIAASLSLLAMIYFVGVRILVYFRLIEVENLIPGVTLIVSSLLLLGGIILICLGMIGEYIGRIYDEVKNRPYFIVEDKIGFEE